MQTLTDRDLSRLMALQYVHGGSLRYVPHGIGESFDTLKDTELITMCTTEDERGLGVIEPDDAEITEKGKRVAEAGMMAMREALGAK